MGGDDGKGGQTWHRNGNFIKEEGHVTDLITRESIQWIESNKDKPFFLYVPYTAPHEKCLDTPEWIAKCAHIPEKLREYAAMVAHMDAGIGQIVETLDRLGLRENTLIVFSSDNGGRPAKPFRGAKGTVWEGGVRVVALANWPTKLGKGILTNPVCIVDWMPTFCALAKIPAPDLLDGRDIWPLLSQPEVPSEARPLYLLGREPSKQAALVYGDWKLVRMPTGDEIYNVTEDLAEGRNLATEEPNRMKQMQELLHETAVRDGDAVAAIIDKQRQPGTSE
jgi:arylsulfatase A-like enzyme